MNYNLRTASCSIFSCCFGHSPIPVVIDAVLENKYARNLFGMLQSSYVFIVGSPYCVTPSLKTLQKSLQLNLRLWSWNTTVRCQMAFWNRRIYSSLQTTKEKLCWVLANSLSQGDCEGEKGGEQPTNPWVLQQQVTSMATQSCCSAPHPWQRGERGIPRKAASPNPPELKAGALLWCFTGVLQAGVLLYWPWKRHQLLGGSVGWCRELPCVHAAFHWELLPSGGVQAPGTPQLLQVLLQCAETVVQWHRRREKEKSFGNSLVAWNFTMFQWHFLSD